MAIPNVSTIYQRIHKGSEGGSEFARLMNYLYTSESKAEGWSFEPYSDASGDYKGVDALIETGESSKGYQFKFYPSPLSASHKAEITKAVKTAMEKAPDNFKNLYIVTPEDLMKEDKTWFEKLKDLYEKRENYNEFYGLLIGIEHVGHTKIMELALRHPHIGKRCFPELFPYEADLFKIATVDIDRKNFIFDFSFTNDSPSTYLLNQIDLIRMDLWSAISGLPEEHYLKSLGELEFKVDMEKEINHLPFSNSIIFKANNSMRFKIQLLDFAKTCPGSGVEFKFHFLFNNGEFFIETKPIMLNIL